MADASVLNLAVSLVKGQEEIDRIAAAVLSQADSCQWQPLVARTLGLETQGCKRSDNGVDLLRRDEHVHVDVDGAAGVGYVGERERPPEGVAEVGRGEGAMDIDNEADQA
ncbi:MAG: hypothetical protein M3Y04_06715, partial [Actinomycetota bacterium]|nr:hypothetical protein [Actinomycetota bacterium]